MKQTEHFKIFGKKYIGNLTNKINTVYFEYNEKKFEVEVLYVKTLNKYAFVQSWNMSKIEYEDKMIEMGLGTKKRKNEFIEGLQKYSKLGPMKEIDVK